MKRGLIALAGALAVVALPAAASDNLQNLLDNLAPPAVPQGSVDVTGWIETSPEGQELVVSLVPHGAAKLVGDPGITVTPLPTPAAGEPVALVKPDEPYLKEPPQVRVPLAAMPAGAPVEAQVDYAYCLADYQCLFGEARVRVEGSPPQG
ncbi:MAG: hypothetical protein U1E14_14865 [Geminicoccaceae bacterium]